MRITSITARSYRVHKDLTVELDRSLTVLGGPNEAGKSTLIEAAHRSLFLRARTTGETQKSMVSNFYPGQPEVEVCFETGETSYRLIKRFAGTSGTASLTAVNGPSWHGEEAEARLSELLGVEATGGGRGVGDRVAQQWAHLWVLQGAAGEDPIQHATNQRDSLIARLQSQGGAAAMQSELDASVAQIVAEQQEKLFTRSGAPKKGSELARATDALKNATSDHAEAQDTYAKLEQAVNDYREAEQTIQCSQGTLVKLAAELDAVQRKLDCVASLRNDERDQVQAAQTAASSHDTLQERDARIRKMREEIRSHSEALTPRTAQIQRCKDHESECLQTARNADEAYQQSTLSVRSARSRHELSSAYVTLCEKTRQLNLLQDKLRQVRGIRDHRAGLESDVAKTPTIQASDLKRIQRLDRKRTQATVALQAMAAGVDVVASDCVVRIGEKTLAVGDSEILADDTEIAIGSSVRLRVRPGGGTDLLEAQRQVGSASRELQDIFDAHGIKSATEAEEAYARRQNLEKKIEVDTAHLKGLSADTLEKEVSEAEVVLVAAAAAVTHRVSSLDGFPAPSDEDAARSLLVETENQLRDAETVESRCRAESDRADRCLQDARRAREEHEQALQQESDRLRDLKAEVKVHVENDGEDAERSVKLTELLAHKTDAQNRLAGTRKALAELQPDLLERDKERHRRSVEEFTAKKGAAEERRSEARGVLHRDGSTDPQEALACAEATLRSAQEAFASVQERAQAIRLLHDLFCEEQRNLADQFAKPFADKVAGYLECVFGVGVNVKVRLENNAFGGLQIIRSGYGYGEFSFDSLSAGTKEQLAAAVRLAMAEILADGHDDCLPLVFDDAFAYSDPDRIQALQRMLDLAASRGLQIIIVTCNPSDYATLGAKEVTLRPQLHSRVPSQDGQLNPAPRDEGPLLTTNEGDAATAPRVEITDEMGNRLLSTLRAFGGSKGNISLRQSLGWDDDTYEAVKNDLIARGWIVTGRGRGGSVALASEALSGDSP